MWNVLKWVLAALAAGFIGQFGRTFALRLIERRRRAKARETMSDVPIPAQDSAEVQLEKARLEADAKIEKKRAKAEAKRVKKSANSEGERDG
ncbi:hypothetical protein ACFLTM_00335 [Candidatus Bipolaricaulota bacterium]